MSIKAIIASQFDASGVLKAQKSFDKLTKSVRGTVGALGLTVGLAASVNLLRNAAKAATEDAKSQALLASQLQNSINATDEQIASVESSIRIMQMQAAVADDVLRPAFAQLVRATGDVGQATKLTQLALDVSAGTGRDLGSVTVALSKAYQGNTTALSRLGIKAKEGVNVFEQLSVQFAGAAEAAANNDPFQRLNISLGEMQEQLGAVVLPYISEFADLMASSDFSSSVSNLFVALKNVGGQLDVLFKQVSGKGAFQTLIDLASAAAVGLSQIVFTLADIGTTAGFIFTGQWDKAGKQMGSFFTRYNRFVKGIYAEQDKAAANAGKYTPFTSFTATPFGGTTKTKGTTTSTKKTAAEKAREEAAKAAEAARKAAAKAAEEYRQQLADIAQAFQEFRDDLQDLAKTVMPAAFTIRELGQFEQATVDSFQAITDQLAKGVKEGKILNDKSYQNLLTYVGQEKSALALLAKQRDEIVTKRSLAKATFDEVKSAIVGIGQLSGLLEKQTQTVTQTITKIVNGVSVATTRSIEEVVGGGTLVTKYQAILAKVRAFASQLKELKSLGLNANLFKQIVDAGPDVGGELANEILAGGKDSVIALNDTFTELETVASTVAEQTAVVMHNAGQDVVGGLINGLMAQEQALVSTAEALANAFLTKFNEMTAQLATPVPTAPAPGTSAPFIQKTYTLAELKNVNLGAVTSDSIWQKNAALASQAMKVSRNAATTITVNVRAGLNTNGKAVGQAIQNELNKYLQASGK